MRIVLDANVLVSGIFWSGHPFRILDLWAHDKLQVLVSDAIMREYAATLDEIGRRRNEARLAKAWTLFIFQHATMIDVVTAVSDCRDPDDNKYLACAIDGDAGAIISGDKDLLVLESFRGIPIVKPRTFLDSLG